MKDFKTPTATRDALLDGIFGEDWDAQELNDLVPKLQAMTDKSRSPALAARVLPMSLWASLMSVNEQGDYLLMCAPDLAIAIGDGDATERGLGCPATNQALYLMSLEQWPGGDSSEEMALAQDE